MKAAAVLGVILFLTGAQLALGSCDFSKDKGERFVTLIAAAFAASGRFATFATCPRSAISAAIGSGYFRCTSRADQRRSRLL
jgi:type IV secretory pathway VirB2 component (pilin)